MNPRIVASVLKKCCGHRQGESVLIVADAALESPANEFQREAAALGCDVSLIAIPSRGAPGEEPPRAAAEAMNACAIAILMTAKSLTHTQACREAREKHGVRIASMPGADPRRLERLLDVDYDALQAQCDALAKLLEGHARVRVTTPAGTDLSFSISGRPVHRDCGNLAARGAFGNLPAGEVCLAPVEGTAEGIVRVDGSIVGVGRLKEPAFIRFSQGRAIEVGDAALQRMLEPHGPDAFQLAEFGIGTNPHAAVIGNVLEDEKAVGTVHVALGSNRALGGTIHAGIHVDAILLGARVEVDGTPLPEAFLTALPIPPEAEPVAPDVSPGEFFKTLFEGAHDAQYVLDFPTQKFIEVNHAFERLTGYTRAELLERRAESLVARESVRTFEQKHEARRSQSSERYELKILTKAGEKMPAEFSVRRFVLGGREIVVGAVRDVTQRKRVEQDMWSKIEELGYANSRIYALTEKIRRVPELTPQLLHITDEQELLERTAQLLCSREGLGYANVSFHLGREDFLETAFSTGAKTARKRRIRLSDDHHLVRIFKGLEPGEVGDREGILPLKGREHNIGVLEVRFDPKEIEILKANERALKGYRNLLETLSNIIGLLVENLQLYETIRRQAVVDPLTGVYNRRYLDTKLLEEIIRAARYNRDLAILMIDLDHFGDINNTMGHKQGDIILAETARLFRNHTRDADTVCRYGGDEFAILLPETTLEGGLAKAESLLHAVRALEFSNVVDPAHPMRITLSVGVAAFHAGVKSGDDLLRAADGALYASKGAGRNTVRTTASPSAPKP